MTQSKAQISRQRDYLKNHFEVLNEGENIDFCLINKDYPHSDVYIFGAFHGSEKPQVIDFNLFKQLVLNNNVRYYLPEMDFSLAHYLNKFIKFGDIELLKLILLKYQKRVPQDASIQFFNKWVRIKKFNDSLPEEKKIQIIGIDAIISPNLFLNYLDELLRSSSYSNVIIDSLSEYKNKEWDDYELYNNQSSALGNFLLKINYDLKKDVEKYKKGLAFNFFEFKMLIDNASYIVGNKYIDRDSIMAANYIALKNNNKLAEGSSYGFLGFTHVFQNKIGDASPFGRCLREKNILVTSILALMKSCDVMWKLNRTKGSYRGYSISHSQAGYRWNYRPMGIGLLNSLAGKNNLTLFSLNTEGSPFHSQLSFVNLSRGAKRNGWLIDTNLTTLDFIQYVIFIKNSKAAIPIQAVFPNLENDLTI